MIFKACLLLATISCSNVWGQETPAAEVLGVGRKFVLFEKPSTHLEAQRLCHRHGMKIAHARDFAEDELLQSLAKGRSKAFWVDGTSTGHPSSPFRTGSTETKLLSQDGTVFIHKFPMGYTSYDDPKACSQESICCGLVKDTKAKESEALSAPYHLEPCNRTNSVACMSEECPKNTCYPGSQDGGNNRGGNQGGQNGEAGNQGKGNTKQEVKAEVKPETKPAVKPAPPAQKRRVIKYNF